MSRGLGDVYKRQIANSVVMSDSLPEIVSNETEEDDDGFMLLNTPEKVEPSTMSRTQKTQNPETSPEAMQQDGDEVEKTEEEKRTDEEQAWKNLKIIEEIDKRDEEALMEELVIEEVLDLEQGISRDLIPAITCPLTGEQYYIDP